tara:strand:- start:5201 stop:7111 length:1911 start_codon:yes stop_codon:yes gene_type:complete
MSESEVTGVPQARSIARIVTVLAVGLAVFQLWQPLAGFVPAGAMPFEALLGAQPALYFRPTHLCWILCLGFLVNPLGAATWQRALDWLALLAVVWASWQVLDFDYRGIDHLLNGLASVDFAAGLVIVVATLEMARRAVGPVMMWIGIVFILYAAFGNYLPDTLATKGFSFERILRFQIFSNAGLFGAPLGIAAGAVFSFVLFGAFLQVTGAGKFLIDLSFALAGRYRGGPAKASVIASAAMGSISGSAIANTVTTGALTIPMMKKLGYRSHQAAGIEAAASTGGQIMPPIMGAGAFVMAEFTNTPYGDIVWMALVPAVLYFSSVLLYVHLMAVKADFTVAEAGERLAKVMLDGVHFLLPLVLIAALLMQNYSPVLVGTIGCGAIYLVSLLRAGSRANLTSIISGLKSGALMAVSISVSCAVAGIVVGTIGQTGIGLQFTESVVALSDGRLWLALILVAIAALILGMGLPATAAYIVLAVMTGPALQELGLALITAHMIIFWLAQSSNVTPPIALAAFAGAGIAGAGPMRSAVEAFKLANGLFVIPLMMAYTPLLYGVDAGWGDVLWAALLSTAVMVTLAGLLERFWFTRMSGRHALFAAPALPLLLWPDWRSQLAGLALFLLMLLNNWRKSRQVSN